MVRSKLAVWCFTEFPLVQDSLAFMDDIIDNAILRAGGLPLAPPDSLAHLTMFTLRSLLCTGTEIGIRDKKNIPNTVSVLGILFHEKNIPNTVTVLGILSLLSKTILGILFQVYFNRDNIPIIKLALNRYSK